MESITCIHTKNENSIFGTDQTQTVLVTKLVPILYLFNLHILSMSMMKKLRRISFKWQIAIFASVAVAVILALYVDCGSFYRVDCHQVILNR